MFTAVPRLRNPVVLAHGIMGYDRIRLAGVVVKDYFPGIGEKLQAAGNRVLRPRTSATASVKQRASELLADIDRAAPHEPVHIIAHSMGGLDARYLISKLAPAGRVLSLTTVGTPHRGSAFAD